MEMEISYQHEPKGSKFNELGKSVHLESCAYCENAA